MHAHETAVTSSTPKLGTVLCRRCGKFIDELDTNRVKFFYTDCCEDSCTDNRMDREED